MRSLILLFFLSLAAPALAAGPASPSQSCLTPFVHTNKTGKKTFSFKPRVQTPGPNPSDIEDEPLASLTCSPAGRIIDAINGEEDTAHGASMITIMDGQRRTFIFSDMALDFHLSPDRRFVIYSPWGGPDGNESTIAAQTTYLVAIDQPLKPDSQDVLSAIRIYPTEADSFHPSAHPKLDNSESERWDKWFDWFETLPQAGGITWTGPRQFTFPLNGDSPDGPNRPWSGKIFQVTATIVSLESGPPKLVLSIPKSPACPRGVAAIHAVIDAMTACLK
jgi:hypothetical protein